MSEAALAELFRVLDESFGSGDDDDPDYEMAGRREYPADGNAFAVIKSRGVRQPDKKTKRVRRKRSKRLPKPGVSKAVLLAWAYGDAYLPGFVPRDTLVEFLWKLVKRKHVVVSFVASSLP
jgi:hypothetical protein